MIKLNIDELKPGMVLAYPVYNRHDVLLLESGARVTKKSIRIFKSWGVVHVVVKGDPGSDESGVASAGPEVQVSIENRLQKRFSEVLDDPVMAEIFKAASKQLAKNLQARENNHERN